MEIILHISKLFSRGTLEESNFEGATVLSVLLHYYSKMAALFGNFRVIVGSMMHRSGLLYMENLRFNYIFLLSEKSILFVKFKQCPFDFFFFLLKINILWVPLDGNALSLSGPLRSLMFTSQFHICAPFNLLTLCRSSFSTFLVISKAETKWKHWEAKIFTPLHSVN